MKASNQIKLSFLSRSANEGFARIAVAAFAAQLDPTVEEISEIKTAVSEAVTNCIVHGYRNTLGTIYLTARIYDNGKLTITIKDRGQGIEDVARAMEPLFTTGNTEERSGMGFTIMETFMDKVRVRSKPSVGTTVTFTKQICSKE
ncbi:MAG: anti-sigma F factor [Clostridia bacterium]|nr:anti-sigma F factor [Clostridia bacterium]